MGRGVGDNHIVPADRDIIQHAINRHFVDYQLIRYLFGIPIDKPENPLGGVKLLDQLNDLGRRHPASECQIVKWPAHLNLAHVLLCLNGLA